MKGRNMTDRIFPKTEGPYATSNGTKAYAIHKVGGGCRWEPDLDHARFFNTLDEARRSTGKVPCATCIGR